MCYGGLRDARRFPDRLIWSDRCCTWCPLFIYPAKRKPAGPAAALVRPVSALEFLVLPADWYCLRNLLLGHTAIDERGLHAACL